MTIFFLSRPSFAIANIRRVCFRSPFTCNFPRTYHAVRGGEDKGGKYADDGNCTQKRSGSRARNVRGERREDQWLECGKVAGLRSECDAVAINTTSNLTPHKIPVYASRSMVESYDLRTSMVAYPCSKQVPSHNFLRPRNSGSTYLV